MSHYISMIAFAVFMTAFAVFMTAFAVFNTARCFADEHILIGMVFLLMAFGGVCSTCALWDEMKEERRKRRKVV